eukprot:6541777-Alexandrium_andersonii.AAC.1
MSLKGSPPMRPGRRPAPGTRGASSRCHASESAARGTPSCSRETAVLRPRAAWQPTLGGSCRETASAQGSRRGRVHSG